MRTHRLFRTLASLGLALAVTLTTPLAASADPVAAPPLPLAAPTAAAKAPAAFDLTGSGWGHGVGLSQYGAQAMAKAGRSTEQILQHYYRGTTVGKNDKGRLVDVNVRYQTGRITASLRALQPRAILEVCGMRAGKCAKKRRVVDATADTATAGQVVIERNGARVRARVTNAKGRTHTVAGRTVRLRWTGTRYAKGRNAVLRLDTGREYRHGRLWVYPYGSSALNGVVRLNLQREYLRGIAEMPSSWEPAALRAQAIIARTYALRVAPGIKSDCRCSLRDSVVNQVYAGWAKESEGTNRSFGKRWVSAVKATRGTVVRYGSALAETFYYSSSGGSTLNSEDVWSAQVPYLRAVKDPWSVTEANPNRSWTTRITQKQAQQLFGLKRVLRIEITGRHTGGGLRELTAYGPKNTKKLSGKADQMRIRLGLKSSWLNDIAAVT